MEASHHHIHNSHDFDDGRGMFHFVSVHVISHSTVATFASAFERFDASFQERWPPLRIVVSREFFVLFQTTEFARGSVTRTKTPFTGDSHIDTVALSPHLT